MLRPLGNSTTSWAAINTDRPSGETALTSSDSGGPSDPLISSILFPVVGSMEPRTVSNSLMTSIKAEFLLFLSHQATIAGGWNSNITLPEDPDELLAQIISGISSSIDIPTELRQRLLETNECSERLEKLVPILQKGNEIMREQSEKTNPFQGNRLN